MMGYLMPDQPGVLQPPKDGWHDTGDVVDVDEDGFIRIKGRAKRFAKIGGEMISLAAVESYINQASPEGHHVVVAVADERKGEQLILVTNDESLSRHTVKEAAKAAQVSEIMVPRTVILVEEMPVLALVKPIIRRCRKSRRSLQKRLIPTDPAVRCLKIRLDKSVPVSGRNRFWRARFALGVAGVGFPHKCRPASAVPAVPDDTDAP